MTAHAQAHLQDKDAFKCRKCKNTVRTTPAASRKTQAKGQQISLKCQREEQHHRTKDTSAESKERTVHRFYDPQARTDGLREEVETETIQRPKEHEEVHKLMKETLEFNYENREFDEEEYGAEANAGRDEFGRRIPKGERRAGELIPKEGLKLFGAVEKMVEEMVQKEQTTPEFLALKDEAIGKWNEDEVAYLTKDFVTKTMSHLQLGTMGPSGEYSGWLTLRRIQDILNQQEPLPHGFPKVHDEDDYRPHLQAAVENPVRMAALMAPIPADDEPGAGDYAGACCSGAMRRAVMESCSPEAEARRRADAFQSHWRCENVDSLREYLRMKLDQQKRLEKENKEMERRQFAALTNTIFPLRIHDCPGAYHWTRQGMHLYVNCPFRRWLLIPPGGDRGPYMEYIIIQTRENLEFEALQLHELMLHCMKAYMRRMVEKLQKEGGGFLFWATSKEADEEWSQWLFVEGTKHLVQQMWPGGPGRRELSSSGPRVRVCLVGRAVD